MSARTRGARRSRPAARARRAKAGLERTWKDTRAALSSAEAKVEKRVQDLVKRSGVDTRQAGKALVAWRHRLDRQGRKAIKQVEGRLAVLQTRARKERRVLGRAVDDAVRRTLAALNIPSRQEIHDLTRRVEELSQRIDRFRRR
jgi:polyhydroxyalkanoate synthesis regulator phasin